MNEEAATYTVPVPDDKGGTRLDRFLADALPHLSRNRLKALAEAGQVIGPQGRAAESVSAKVRGGEIYTVVVPESAPAAPRAQDIHLNVVYEDAHLIVIDKPAGLVVHPAAGNPDGTLVNALLAHCGDSRCPASAACKRPGIVHRIDKDTSGLLVVGQEQTRAHNGLAEQFARPRAWSASTSAVVWGLPSRRRPGEIEAAISAASPARPKNA